MLRFTLRRVPRHVRPYCTPAREQPATTDKDIIRSLIEENRGLYGQLEAAKEEINALKAARTQGSSAPRVVLATGALGIFSYGVYDGTGTSLVMVAAIWLFVAAHI
jgi:hypothetical protein